MSDMKPRVLTIENGQQLVTDVLAALADGMKREILEYPMLAERLAEGLAEGLGEDQEIKKLKADIFKLELKVKKIELEAKLKSHEVEVAKLEAEKLEAEARAHKAKSQVPRAQPKHAEVVQQVSEIKPQVKQPSAAQLRWEKKQREMKERQDREAAKGKNQGPLTSHIRGLENVKLESTMPVIPSHVPEAQQVQAS